jgi:DNA-directed RNA polymerase subunit K/omega
LLPDGSETQTLGNRFLLAAIAFLRSKQLSDGARARVVGDRHKATSIAVLEVLADTVSWSRVSPAGAGQPPHEASEPHERKGG